MAEIAKYTTQVEPYVKEWYGYLWDGKLMGVKCKACGHVSFPPYAACDECGKADMEWVEIPGKGQLVNMSQSTSGILPFKLEPVIVGWVELEEGGVFMSWLEDVDQDLAAQEALNKTLPRPVTMDIRVMDEENQIAYPVLHLAE